MIRPGPSLVRPLNKQTDDETSRKKEIVARCKLNTQAEIDARLRKVGALAPQEAEQRVREHRRCVRLRRAARGLTSR